MTDRRADIEARILSFCRIDPENGCWLWQGGTSADPAARIKWMECHRTPPGPDRWKIRSTTYQGIADAIGAQWGALTPLAMVAE